MSEHNVFDHYITDVVDASPGLMTDNSLNDLASNTNTQFTVNAVSVPTAIWLFSSGLLGLASITQCKKIIKYSCI